MTDPTQGSGRASAEDVKNQSEFYELLVRSTEKEKQLLEIERKRAEALGLQSELYEAELNFQNKILLNLQNNQDALDKQIVTQQMLDEANQKAIIIQEDLTRAIQEYGEASLKNDEESIKNRELLGDYIKDLTAQQAEFNRIIESGVKSFEDILGEMGMSKSTMDLIIEDGKTLAQLFEENKDNEQKRKDLLEKARGINENVLEVNRKVNGVTSKIAQHVGLSAKSSDTFLGSQLDILTSSAAIGENMKLSELIQKNLFGQSLSLKNVFINILETTAKMALEISNASRELGAATGFGDQFNNELAVMAQRGNMAGISFRESGEALKSLTGNLSSFNPKAEKTNINLGMTVARLQKLGVSTASSVKMIDHLQRAMGMGAEAAANMTAEIARMGKNIGITGTKMIEQFNSAAGRLAIYGQRGTQVFKELAAASKAAGIEMTTLLGITKKFDTFEGAAQQASQLNAVLGTQLSTLELLQASDSERIMMIKQQVQMSVGNFENLDKFTKMYVAQAMGVSDVAEAQRLLNMSTAEYQKYVAGQQKSADIQKELAEATEELVPMMQQLKLAGTQILMIFKPIITVFSGIINLISWLITGIASFFPKVDAGGKIIEYLIGVVTLVSIAFYAFGASMLAALGPIGLIIAGLTLLFGAFHLKGSPELWELPEHAGKGYENMANSMGVAAQAANATSASMKKVHDSFHKAGGKSFSIEAMAKLDTEKIAAGLTKVKSAMMELSTLKIDGFLAMSTDGAKSSIVMGSQGVIKSLSEGRLTIDVNMPEIALPPINVVVKVNDANLAGVIDARVEKRSYNV